MSNCFYCDYNIVEEKTQHLVSFQTEQNEREEILCNHCYSEYWLHGIKG